MCERKFEQVKLVKLTLATFSVYDGICKGDIITTILIGPFRFHDFTILQYICSSPYVPQNVHQKQIIYFNSIKPGYFTT